MSRLDTIEYDDSEIYSEGIAMDDVCKSNKERVAALFSVNF